MADDVSELRVMQQCKSDPDLGASDFPPPLLPFSLFRLVGKCACAQAMGSPGLLPILVVRLGAAFDPGWT